MEVKILGPGCPNCKRLEKVAREALAEMGVEASVTKVTDMTDIMAYNVFATPALVIDGKVVTAGQIPSKSEIVSMLATALAEAEA